MFWTRPPRSLSDLMRMPLSAPLIVQLMKVMLDTPPLSVSLPMDRPCPLPYVLLVTRTPEVGPPQVKSSSPTLMLQFWTRMFVPLTSQASVFFAGGFASDGGA